MWKVLQVFYNCNNLHFSIYHAVQCYLANKSRFPKNKRYLFNILILCEFRLPTYSLKMSEYYTFKWQWEQPVLRLLGTTLSRVTGFCFSYGTGVVWAAANRMEPLSPSGTKAKLQGRQYFLTLFPPVSLSNPLPKPQCPLVIWQRHHSVLPCCPLLLGGLILRPPLP